MKQFEYQTITAERRLMFVGDRERAKGQGAKAKVLKNEIPIVVGCCPPQDLEPQVEDHKGKRTLEFVIIEDR